jgi:hypothetical protein
MAKRVKGLTQISCPHCGKAQFVEAMTTDFRFVADQLLVCANADCKEEFIVGKHYKIVAGPFLR